MASPRPTTRRFAHPHRPPLDMQRVARAVLLQVETLGEGVYRVFGEGDAYFVSLAPHFTCDCGDAIFRESICKHQVAALYYEGDAEAVAIVAELREAYRARRSAARRAAAQAAGEATGPLPPAAIAEPIHPSPNAAGLESADGEEPPTAPAQPAERVVLRNWWR